MDAHDARLGARRRDACDLTENETDAFDAIHRRGMEHGIAAGANPFDAIRGAIIDKELGPTSIFPDAN